MNSQAFSWPCKPAQFWHEPVLPQPNLGSTRRPGLPVLPRARSWDTGRSGTKALTSQGVENGFGKRGSACVSLEVLEVGCSSA